MAGKQGGKRTKRGKKASTAPQERFVPHPETDKDQMFAIAHKMLGNRRLTVKCADGRERMAIIPGKFKGKRHWVGVGTLVLLNLRNFQDEKCDIIHIYEAQDANRLQRQKHLGLLKVKERQETVNDNFDFDSDSDSDNGSDNDSVNSVDNDSDSSVDGAVDSSSDDSDDDIDIERL